MNARRKISLILLSLFLLFGGAAAAFGSASAAPETAATCTKTHIVQRGEYLVMIAKLYKTDWRTLAEVNNLKNPNLIYVNQKLCITTTGSGPIPTVDLPNTSSGVRVYAASVKEDQTVTLQGKSLVPNSRYSVYLSNYKANHPVDLLVGSVTTDKNGAFKVTFSIPKNLIDVSKIRIKIINGQGSTASNWFINGTSSGGFTGGVGMPTLKFSIQSVEEDDWVKIKTSNLPANVTFHVYIGKAGSEGEKGIHVGTLRDKKGGSITATFDIPEELRDRSKLDIRLENDTLDIVAFLTFENKDKR